MTTDSTMTERVPVKLLPWQREALDRIAASAGESRANTIRRLTREDEAWEGLLPDDPSDGEERGLPDPVDERYLIACVGLSRAQVERLAEKVQPRTFRPGKREWDRDRVEEWLALL